MNTTTTNLFKAISKTETKELTIIVKETLAFGVAQTQGKHFTAADLWNIQRQKRSILQRKHYA
ncbi:hypothetical protein [Ferruginibacter sp.]|nr:hypothetical protein [Ferruginibacter sp.]